MDSSEAKDIEQLLELAESNLQASSAQDLSTHARTELYQLSVARSNLAIAKMMKLSLNTQDPGVPAILQAVSELRSIHESLQAIKSSLDFTDPTSVQMTLWAIKNG